MPHKVFLHKRHKPKSIRQSPEVDKVVIELEIKGVVVNRITKKEGKESSSTINDLKELYPKNGVVFLIKESKMNFKSLMDQHLKMI